MKSRLFNLAIAILIISACSSPKENAREQPPNFLLLLSDNHYYSHLGCYGDPVVKTPAIDQLASEGIRFTNAFCAAPSCTPARGALLAGQDIWRLGNGGNLWSSLADTIATYPDLLETNGYHVGHDRKGWGPGDFKAGGRNRNPAGYTFKNLEEFLDKKKDGQSWSFWLSSRNPHRPFEYGAGIASGMDPSKVEVPPYLPDSPEVRSDICDYYYQIQQFDKEVAEAIELIKQRGELDNTFIMICGDNGWMMPRGLANLYDYGTRVPLIINWPKKIKQKRVVTDFVSLNDLAPTILDLAGIEIPEQMTAKSLVSIMNSDKAGRVDAERDFIVTARERHALVRKGGLGYPGRSIRSDDYLFIHNITPERWPAGDPPLFGDIDLHMLQGKSPTKEYMMLNKDSEGVKQLYEQAFLKRPEFELFDLNKDPYQLENVAYDSSYAEVKEDLINKMTNYLQATLDPRVIGEPVDWDELPYYKEKDWIGKPRKEAQELFGLKQSYSYYD
ncbi:MAG: sulfatase [Cyclobacteriaceae bacterium]